MRERKKIFHANGNDRKSRVTILISAKVGFKTVSIKKDKGHYIMLKRSIQGDDIIPINIYVPNM